MEPRVAMEHLARDGARMAALARGDLSVPVPTCPEWTLRDLIEHCGFVHRWQTAAVRDRTDDFPPEDTWQIGPRDGESWADWFQAGVDEAVAVLGAVAPSEHRWTWFAPDQTAGWYHVRTPQETSVHRIDAELAATGSADPVDPAFAVEGVDELFFVMVPSADETDLGGSGETILVEATDADAAWVVTLEPRTVSVAKTRADTTSCVRGSATDLLLWVWGRPPLGPLDYAGDASPIDRLSAAFRE